MIMKVQHKYINFLLCKELKKIERLVKTRKRDLDKATLVLKEEQIAYEKALKMAEVLENHIGEKLDYKEGEIFTDEQLGLDNDEFSESV